jgi:hypothetical protein
MPPQSSTAIQRVALLRRNFRARRLYLLMTSGSLEQRIEYGMDHPKRPHAVCGKSTLEQEFLSTNCLKMMGSEANRHLLG